MLGRRHCDAALVAGSGCARLTLGKSIGVFSILLEGPGSRIRQLGNQSDQQGRYPQPDDDRNKNEQQETRHTATFGPLLLRHQQGLPKGARPVAGCGS